MHIRLLWWRRICACAHTLDPKWAYAHTILGNHAVRPKTKTRMYYNSNFKLVSFFRFSFASLILHVYVCVVAVCRLPYVRRCKAVCSTNEGEVGRGVHSMWAKLLSFGGSLSVIQLHGAHHTRAHSIWYIRTPWLSMKQPKINTQPSSNDKVVCDAYVLHAPI